MSALRIEVGHHRHSGPRGGERHLLNTQTVDTTFLPPAERFDFWHSLMAGEQAPVQLCSDQAHDFAAVVSVTDLGPARLASFRYPSVQMYRTAKLIRQSDPEVYQFALPTAGRSAISHGRRESALRAADFTFIDYSRPSRVTHTPDLDASRTASSLTILFPHSALPLPPRRVDDLLAARLPSGTGIGALLAHHLCHIAEHPDQYQPSDATRLGDIMLDLISSVLAQQLDIEQVLPARVQQQALRTRIRAHIEMHLGDPALSPSTVAAAHHISIRTLHRLFQAEETTVADLIRTRRLQRCRRDLADPLLQDQPIYVIGARWGFLDKAHFSRLFRTAYGTSPQQFREHLYTPS
jgi:AraC-like DNA-binding protein